MIPRVEGTRVISPDEFEYRPALQVYERASAKAHSLKLDYLTREGITIRTLGLDTRFFTHDTIITYTARLNGKEVPIAHAFYSTEWDPKVSDGRGGEVGIFYFNLNTEPGASLQERLSFLKALDISKYRAIPTIKIEGQEYEVTPHSSSDSRHRLSHSTKEVRGPHTYRVLLP